MRRRTFVLATELAFASFVGCSSMQTTSPGSSGGSGAPAGGSAISGATTGGAGMAGANALAGTSGSSLTDAGSTTTMLGGGGGGGTGGVGGDGVAGGNGGAPVAGSAGMASGAVANAGCPAGTFICEDFERYPSGATNLSPEWTAYSYQGGVVRVDASKPFAGARSLHLNTSAGTRRYADIVKINPPTEPLFSNKHYGRAMVWLTSIPSQAHFLINHASGPLAADPSTVAKYSYGGHLGQLEPTYSQKMPVGGVDHPALRGGGPELGDPFPAPVDCQRTATSEPVPVKRWLCWEWSFDADKSETKLWIDGQAMPQVDLSAATPGSCKTVQGPKLFNKLVIGWDVYTSPSELDQEAWIDDVAVSETRVGCPAP
jgi:hypothetical protein